MSRFFAGQACLKNPCRVRVLLALLLAAPVGAHAQLPTPQLTSVFPPGAQAGANLEIRVAGTDLDDAAQLQFSHPGIVATAKMSAATEFEKSKPVSNLFQVQVASDVPPGRYDARVVGRFGVSNPRAFLVGQLAESNDPGGNNKPESATPLTVDSVINGTADANQVDHFKLPLKANQRVILECRAQRIDSRLDAMLVLLDPQGKELDRNRGYELRDPLLDFTAPADGEYRVQLYDFTYRGGADHFYRLTAHTSPHLDVVFPPSGLPGSNDPYLVFGRNLPGGQPAEGITIGGSPVQQLPVHIALPSDDESRRDLDDKSLVSSHSAFLDGLTYRLQNSNPVRIDYAKSSVVREQEPNQDAAHSQTVVAPCEIVGQFYPAADVDSYQFAAKKGDVFYLEVYCHRRGLSADPFMLIEKVKRNEKGEEVVQEIAQVDDPGDRAARIGSEFDTSTDDPEYKLTADEDATYRVSVRDQFGTSRTDPRFVYRLAIHPGHPDFRLVAYSSPPVVPANPNAVSIGGCVLRQGGATPVELRLERRYGFDGDVEVFAEGLPAGVTCTPVLMGPTSNTATLVFAAAETAPRWVGSVRVLGRATRNGSTITRAARHGVAVWNAANRTQEDVPFRLTPELTLAVLDQDKLPAAATLAEDKVWETSRGGKLEIPVQVARRGEFKEDLTFAANDLPNEIKPPNLAVKGAEAEGKLQFAATNANAKPGVYTFYLRADSKLKHQRNPEAVAVAEQEQKDIDAAIVAVTEQNTKAAEAKNAAVAAATAMAAAAKQAEQLKVTADAEAKQAVEKVTQADAALNAAKEAAAKETANQDLAAAAAAAEKVKADADAAKVAADQKLAAADKAFTDAQALAKAAEDAKVAAEKMATDTDARLKAAQAMKVVVDKRVTDLKAANNPKDLQFAVVSTPIKVRIVETCLQLTPPAAPAALKAGEKTELAIKVDRLYGFADAVEVTVELPNAIKGVTPGKLTLAAGQAEGKLEIVTTAEAPVGTHAVTVRAKGKFNNVDNQAAQPLTLTIAAP